MCPIFDSSPPVFGAKYQSFLRVCWFLHKGVPCFGYLSEQLNNPTDISNHEFLCFNAVSSINIMIRIQSKPVLSFMSVYEALNIIAYSS